MEDATQRLGIPQPDYIKTDVDRIEHLILAGGPSTLKGIVSILIEVNDDFREQADRCQGLLVDGGLVFRPKRRSELNSRSPSRFQSTYNQIWVRS